MLLSQRRNFMLSTFFYLGSEAQVCPSHVAEVVGKT